MRKHRIDVLHGVNLDQLGKRDPEVYGGLSLSELEMRIQGVARELGLETLFFQTNSEGEFAEYLHRAPELADSIIINAGAWTHYSYALHDALESLDIPKVEVHISNVHRREAWRRVSIISPVVDAVIAGMGSRGYVAAVGYIVERLGAPGSGTVRKE